MNMRRSSAILRIGAVVCLLARTSEVRAGIEITSRPAPVQCGLLDTTAEGKFIFKNTGKSTVTITHVTQSCSCTTATLKKRTYRPGESGELKISVELDGLTGRLVKDVAIETDAGPPIVLILEIEIPSPVTITPKEAVFQPGDKMEKQLIIRPAAGVNLQRIELQPTAQPPAGEIKPLPEKEGYALTIYPPLATRPIHRTIFLNVQIATSRGLLTKSVSVPLLVSAGPPASAPSSNGGH